MILLDISIPKACATCPMHQIGVDDHWCAVNEVISWATADDVPKDTRDSKCMITGSVMNRCGNGTIYDADGRAREYDVYNIWRIGSEDV